MAAFEARSMDLTVPVFYPTMDDMKKPFEDYITGIESQIMDVGICKIVPPKEWVPRKAGYSNLNDCIVKKPIQQNVTGSRGVFHALNVERKNMTLREFKKLASLPENNPSHRCAVNDSNSLEREFWKNITLHPALYGADGVGSLFDEKMKHWNVAFLDTILSKKLEENKIAIPGVNTAYLYFGMWRSMFAWHTEDMDLYSVNYLHFGAPKSWYVIPPSHKARFEALVKNLNGNQSKNCKEFFRHKETVISPYVLQKYGIPVIRLEQNVRDFIINCPGAYHSGFNQGFNCAESTNFATEGWIPYGKKAKTCECRDDTVKIDMSIFEPGRASSDLSAGQLADSTPLPELFSDCHTSTSYSLNGESDLYSSERLNRCGVDEIAGKWQKGDSWTTCFHCRVWHRIPDSLRRFSWEDKGRFHCRVLGDPFDCCRDGRLDDESRTNSAVKPKRKRKTIFEESLCIGPPVFTAVVVSEPGDLKMKFRLKRVRDEGPAAAAAEQEDEEAAVGERRSRRVGRKISFD